MVSGLSLVVVSMVSGAPGLLAGLGLCSVDDIVDGAAGVVRGLVDGFAGFLGGPFLAARGERDERGADGEDAGGEQATVQAVSVHGVVLPGSGLVVVSGEASDLHAAAAHE